MVVLRTYSKTFPQPLPFYYITTACLTDIVRFSLVICHGVRLVLSLGWKRDNGIKLELFLRKAREMYRNQTRILCRFFNGIILCLKPLAITVPNKHLYKTSWYSTKIIIFVHLQGWNNVCKG